MKTLFQGDKLLLKQDGDTLILDVTLNGNLTKTQMRRLDDALSLAGEDTWFAAAERRVEVEALVREINAQRVIQWTSLIERERARQQREGGR